MFSHQEQPWPLRASVVLLALGAAFGLGDPSATGRRQFAAAGESGEVILRGGDLVVACFDMPFPGLKNRKHDAPHTICVIRLKHVASPK